MTPGPHPILARLWEGRDMDGAVRIETRIIEGGQGAVEARAPAHWTSAHRTRPITATGMSAAISGSS